MRSMASLQLTSQQSHKRTVQMLLWAEMLEAAAVTWEGPDTCERPPTAAAACPSPASSGSGTRSSVQPSARRACPAATGRRAVGGCHRTHGTPCAAHDAESSPHAAGHRPGAQCTRPRGHSAPGSAAPGSSSCCAGTAGQCTLASATMAVGCWRFPAVRPTTEGNSRHTQAG